MGPAHESHGQPARTDLARDPNLTAGTAVILAGKMPVLRPSLRVSLSALHVAIHGLQRDLSRTAEAVPENLAPATEKSRRQFLIDRLHLHRSFLVDPPAGLDVDLFPGASVSSNTFPYPCSQSTPSLAPAEKVSMKNPVPPSRMLAAPLTRVKEYSTPSVAASHWCSRTSTLPPGVRCSAKTCPAPSRLNAMRPGPRAASEQEGHAGQHPLESALQGVQHDLHRRVLPQQDVMLEVNPDTAQFHLQHRYQFALDVVRDSAKALIRCHCWKLFRHGHDDFLFLRNR